MPITKVLYGQDLSDLVDEEKIFEAADLNGISITDVLTPGVFLIVPTSTPKKLQNEIVSQVVKPVTVKSFEGQTWVDLVLQQLGDEERLFEMCDKNNAGITDDLAPGSVIQSPDFEPEKKAIVNALTKVKPASNNVVVAGEDVEEGIEFWAIEYEFIVS